MTLFIFEYPIIFKKVWTSLLHQFFKFLKVLPKQPLYFEIINNFKTKKSDTTAIKQCIRYELLFIDLITCFRKIWCMGV